MLNEPQNNELDIKLEEYLKKKKHKKIRALISISLAAILLIVSIAFAVFSINDGEVEVLESSDEAIFSQDVSEAESFTESVEDSFIEISEIESSEEEFFPVINVVTPQDVTAAAIYESNSLYCIYSENADSKLSIASITKLITASVAIKYMPIDEVITVGSELSLVKYDSSVCGLKQGYNLTLEQLLYGLLLSSGNDAAYTIAVNVARYVSENEEMSDSDAVNYFCELMNELAIEIGAKNSSFANPEGWDDENNYSTVADLAIIAKYAKSFELISQIVRTTEYVVNFPHAGELKFRNSNYLLHEESRFYSPLVTGLKTGSTSGAGKCLVATIDIEGFEYIAVVMGCPNEETRYTAMLSLIENIKKYNNLKFA